jgi:hypothetical protein
MIKCYNSPLSFVYSFGFSASLYLYCVLSYVYHYIISLFLGSFWMSALLHDCWGVFSFFVSHLHSLLCFWLIVDAVVGPSLLCVCYYL